MLSILRINLKYFLKILLLLYNQAVGHLLVNLKFHKHQVDHKPKKYIYIYIYITYL